MGEKNIYQNAMASGTKAKTCGLPQLKNEPHPGLAFAACSPSAPQVTWMVAKSISRRSETQGFDAPTFKRLGVLLDKIDGCFPGS